MVTLQTLILAASLTGAPDVTLIDFYSDNCAPCRQMAPTIARLEQSGLPVKKVNVSRQPQLATQYGVRGVPCFVMVAGGREVDRVVGATTYDRLLQMYRTAGFERGNEKNAPQAKEPIAPAGRAELANEYEPETQLQQPAPILPRVQQELASEKVPHSAEANSDRQVARALAASVRIQIDEGSGRSYGSGTIIDVQDNEALVLTCGHIFRDSAGKGKIVVDLFPHGKQVSVPGQLIHYDEKRDVGLLAIRPNIQVTSMKIGGPGLRSHRGQRVFSIGCDRGAPPNVRHSRVTAVNKYLGPANIEVAGAPVDGRSGGGLFTADGTLIGVCNAADPQDNEGLYAALETIHAELTAANLSFIYAKEEKLADNNRVSSPTKSGTQPQRTAAARNASPASLQARADGARAADRLSKLDDVEVVCIVRSRSNPEQEQRFVLDRPSEELLGLLARQRSAETRNTSLQFSDNDLQRQNEPSRPIHWPGVVRGQNEK